MCLYSALHYGLYPIEANLNTVLVLHYNTTKKRTVFPSELTCRSLHNHTLIQFPRSFFILISSTTENTKDNVYDAK